MATARTPAGRAGGFTLIEVLAAITVFLVGVVGVMGLLTAGTRLHQESQNQLVQNDVADEVLWMARRDLAERIVHTNGAIPEPTPPVAVPGRPEFRFAWRVEAAPEGRLWRLLVDVLWMENGRERKVTFDRVLTRLSAPVEDVRALTGKRPP